jgi:hypothetical protein
LQAKMMSSRGSVAPSLNRASRRKGAAIKADVNLRVCVVASWTAPAVATVAAIVALEVVTVTAVAVAAAFVAPATVGGAALQRQAEDLGGRARVGAATPPAKLPCLVALVDTGVVADVAAVVVAPRLLVGVPAAGVMAWGSTVGLVVVVEAVAACGAIVPPIAKPPLARATSSSIVLQFAILVAAGMMTVVEATDTPWSMMTAMALGPVPIRLPTMTVGRERVPPNYFQLCVRRTVSFAPTRSTAASISSTRALTLLASIVVRAKAWVKAFIFLFASSLAMLLKCCAQPLLKIAILRFRFGGGVVAFLFFLLRSYSKSL